ncbi:hypothetical protein ABZ816_12370 [Actinosynnema sp. NPDC047251]|uniref:DUF1579 domain-containing protein n=1 Tax=Saccharothrix espanaensis (strain ATCC 51144 / DSM 44229 / JCM 9112 / NBRC 15066 / NRRL 15764) TaxID=1179773 RepID=K0KCV0_SACES|nr:hypothetical protein [Saccharothrix espanaensis]CCH35392.1 hypothetical protein BN6_81750 [Saccharothrix espanaensis DSM 44229]
MSENTNPVPDAELAALDRMVGTWKVTGGAEGTVTYRWLEGGHFLVQDIDLEQYGERILGMEVIGRERPFGAEQASVDIKSRYYGHKGDTLDYVYELEGDVLTIWGGEKGSPAYMRSTFNETGDVLSGAWVYPGGGGYETTSTRITPADR